MLSITLTLITLLTLASTSPILCIEGCCDHTLPLPSKTLLLTPLTPSLTTPQQIILPLAELPCCPCERSPNLGNPPLNPKPGHPPKQPAIKLCGESACCPIDCHCQPDVEIDCSEAQRAIHALNREKLQSLLVASPLKMAPLAGGTQPIATPPAGEDQNRTRPHRPRPPHDGGSEGGLPANCPEGACDDSEFWPCLCIQALVAKGAGGNDLLVADDDDDEASEELSGALQSVLERVRELVAGDVNDDDDDSVAGLNEKEEL